MPKYTKRPKPGISASELAEYMEAFDPGRNRILSAARYRPTVRVRSYAKARAFLTGHMTGGQQDPQAVRERARGLRASIGTMGAFEQQEDALNADMLDRFAESYPQIQIAGSAFVAPPQKTWTWNTGGVDVTISPHFMPVGRDRKGAPICGAAVFEYSKGKAYNPAVAKWFATLLVLYAENGGATLGTASHDLSGCLDVQNGRFHSAPARRAQLLQRMEAACVGIQRQWDSIPEPKGGDEGGDDDIFA